MNRFSLLHSNSTCAPPQRRRQDWRGHVVAGGKMRCMTIPAVSAVGHSMSKQSGAGTAAAVAAGEAVSGRWLARSRPVLAAGRPRRGSGHCPPSTPTLRVAWGAQRRQRLLRVPPPPAPLPPPPSGGVPLNGGVPPSGGRTRRRRSWHRRHGTRRRRRRR